MTVFKEGDEDGIELLDDHCRPEGSHINTDGRTRRRENKKRKSIQKERKTKLKNSVSLSRSVERHQCLVKQNQDQTKQIETKQNESRSEKSRPVREGEEHLGK